MAIDFGQAQDSPVWHPEPGSRGTYSLLSSCFFSLVFCVWFVVLLFLPEHNRSRMFFWWLLWWLLLGLFAPELVAWTAFEQKREARALYMRVKRALGEELPCPLHQRVLSWASRLISTGRKPESTADPEAAAGTATNGNSNAQPAKARRLHPWTMTHSHYAIMGGFAFDTDIVKCQFLSEGHKRAALTSAGVVRLATVAPHLLPDLSVSQIRDKSKASSLAKAIVALQATWFAAQCISRMAVGLTISLLELNTFAHSICALIAYFLWWDKPLDVGEPSLIDGSDAALVGAGMYMKSAMGANCVAAGHFRDTQIVARLWREGEGKIQDSESARLVEHGLMESLSAGGNRTRPFYFKVDAAENDVGGGDGSCTPGQRAASALRSSSPPTTAKTQAASSPQEGGCRLYMGQSMFGFGFRRGRVFHFNLPPFRPTSAGRMFTWNFGAYKDVPKRGFMALQRPYIQLSSADVLRLRLAQQCNQNYPGFIYRPLNREYATPYLKHPNQSHQMWQNEYVVTRTRNWPLSDESCIESEANALYILLSLLFAGKAYGGLHLLAWNPPLTTASQILMWRMSGAIVASFGVLPFVWYMVLVVLDGCLDMIASVNETAFWEWLTRVPDWLFNVADNIRIIVLVVAGSTASVGLYTAPFLYVWARVYLLVECIISVPRLPDAVFETVSWSKYFSHLT